MPVRRAHLGLQQQRRPALQPRHAGQFNEKAALAFRPMARAEWLLAQRVRTRLVQEPEGLYVANSAPLPWSGWVRMLTTALREDYRSIEDPTTGARQKLVFEPGCGPFTPPQSPAELTRREHGRRPSPTTPRGKSPSSGSRSLDGRSHRSASPEHARTADDNPPPADAQADRDRRPRLADRRSPGRG